MRDITTIAPDVLAVDGKVEILRESRGDTREPALLRRFAIFAVMMQESAGWKIRMIRVYQLPEAEAAAARSTAAHDRNPAES